MTKRNFLVPWLICGLGALFYCYEYVLRIMPSVMASDLMQTFDINAFALGNLAAFYYYAYTPMQLPVGVLMDRYGPRRLLVIAALACALGSYLFSHGNIHVAHFGRFMVGFGSAFAFVGVLKLATIWLPPTRFAMIAGWITTLGMLGAMGGVRLMGNLVQNIGWVEVTNFAVIGGVIIAAVFWFAIPHHKKYSPPANNVVKPTLSFKKLLREVVQLLEKPQIWLVGLVGLALYIPLSVFAELWGIPFLQRTYDVPSIRADHLVSMIFLGWAIGSPITGWISDQLRNRRMPLIIGSAMAAVIVVLILYFPHITKAHLGLWFLAFGIASSVEVVVFAIAREISPPELAATAMAITNLLVMLGGVVFQPVLGMLLDMFAGTHATGSLSVYSGRNFQDAMAILPIGLILSVVILLFITETHAKVIGAPEGADNEDNAERSSSNNYSREKLAATV